MVRINKMDGVDMNVNDFNQFWDIRRSMNVSVRLLSDYRCNHYEKAINTNLNNIGSLC